MLPVAIAIKNQCAKASHIVKVVYDAHEYTRGVHRPNSTWLPAMCNAEDSNISQADAVLTVTESICELIKDDHQLAIQPSLIMNAPSLEFTKQEAPFPTLREQLELADDTPLFVYLGVTAPARGLHTVVEALPQLPEVHLALVTSQNATVEQLTKQATELGVSERLHVVPMVSHEWVSSYIRGCTAGVNPALHNPNHEHSISTKFYEYLHAHVPIIVSDLRDMKILTEQIGNGEVFVAEDVDDFVLAAQRLLTNPARYQLAMTPELLREYSWEAQLLKLNEVYKSL
jgi:glycosyltransferase involved in cell wall biosynthesis